MKHEFTDCDTGARVTLSAPGTYPALGPVECRATGDPAQASRLGLYAEILRLAERVKLLEAGIDIAVHPEIRRAAERERKLREALKQFRDLTEESDGVVAAFGEIHKWEEFDLPDFRALLKEE